MRRSSWLSSPVSAAQDLRWATPEKVWWISACLWVLCFYQIMWLRALTDSPFVQFPILINRIVHHHVDQFTEVNKTKSLLQPHGVPQERLRHLRFRNKVLNLEYSEIFWPLCEWRRTPPGIFCPRGPAAPSERSPGRPARSWRETSRPASSLSPVSLRSDRSVRNNLRDCIQWRLKMLYEHQKYEIIR